MSSRLTKRLLDSNSASFQMFLILLSFIAVGSYKKDICGSRGIVFKQCQRNTRISGGGGGACTEANITFFSDKTDTVFHVGTIFNRFNFSGLSLAFILSYYPILHVVKS